MVLPLPNSSDPGYLPPAAPSPPLEGPALQDFLQEVLVGVSGLGGPLVRPRWLAEPSNIPDAGECWCSFGIVSRPSDTFVYIQHDGNANAGEGADRMQRQEELHMIASFYDLGVTGLADMYAAQTRDGLQVPQNLEALLASGFALAYTGELQTMPVLLKMRWQYRVDLPIVFRRQIDRVYNVLNLLSFKGTLYGDPSQNNASSAIGGFIIAESPIEGNIILTDDISVTPDTKIPIGE